MLIVAFMEKNQLRSDIVSSRTRFGAKGLESLNLVFIPSAVVMGQAPGGYWCLFSMGHGTGT